jgi:predicted nucleotidyltransferase
MSLADLLRPLDLLFKKHGIRYALIGGYAVAAWGKARATRDVDLFCASGDSRRLAAALREASLDFEHRTGDWDDPISEVIRIGQASGTEPFEIDVLIGIRNAPAGLFDRIRAVVIDDLSVPVASPEDMIILKLLGGSALDLEDGKSILLAQKERLDLALLRKICPRRLGAPLEQLIASVNSPA